MNAVWTWIERNRFQVLGWVLTAAFVGWSYGCQPKAPDPITGKQVTAAGLDASWDSYVADHDAEFTRMVAAFSAADAEIEQEAAMWRAVWEFAAPAISAAAPQLGPIVGIGSSIMALALGGDNIRKGWKIKQQRAEANAA